MKIINNHFDKYSIWLHDLWNIFINNWENYNLVMYTKTRKTRPILIKDVNLTNSTWSEIKQLVNKGIKGERKRNNIDKSQQEKHRKRQHKISVWITSQSNLEDICTNQKFQLNGTSCYDAMNLWMVLIWIRQLGTFFQNFILYKILLHWSFQF